MKNWLIEVIILVTSFVFYLLAGDGSLAFGLFIFFNYMEFLYPKRLKEKGRDY
jgi:hypothetical protein